jgi:hypothetical protein
MLVEKLAEINSVLEVRRAVWAIIQKMWHLDRCLGFRTTNGDTLRIFYGEKLRDFGMELVGREKRGWNLIRGRNERAGIYQ